MVSDAPHILSREFAFRFDRQRNGNLGLVVPEWLDDPAAQRVRSHAERLLLRHVKRPLREHRSTIYLPAGANAAGKVGLGGMGSGADGASRDVGGALMQRLDPVVVLLLRKVRRVVAL